jgi:hypothetical protein
MINLLVGILFVAAVATFGDYVWFEVGIRHRPTAGALHGAVLLGSVGIVLGWLNKRVLAGLIGGILAGVGGAVAYYALASFGGGGRDNASIIAAWVAVWVVLAAIEGRVLRRASPRSWRESLVRGALAATLSGVAFAAVIGIVWGPTAGGSRNYLMQFLAWTLAWGPGMGAITLSQKSEVRGQK